MNAKQERKRRSHQSILESAARLLRIKGIGGARVADVMEGAGLTVGGFYGHFETKEALIDETLRRAAEANREQLFGGLDEKPEEQRAGLVLERYLSAAHRDAASLGCPFPAVVGEVATTTPEHGRVLGEQIDAMATRLAPLLAAKDREEPARRRAAVAMVALMYGGLSLARALRETEWSEEVLEACRAAGKALIDGTGAAGGS